eukprot:CAMPEP_0113498916 /NCGR_PEP_ID=MMETSP0014_2-20120614/31455_1 /TAXON_ID=2857 /ORGANISM="Nitzschia sp." /LENGTH=376 /DNA_ID=CAMNT_0000393027 /DNA_START=199 /DNA_END=1329 /DNA_ORIENTATION=- /assembly_acc=CAM_ASM_000159
MRRTSSVTISLLQLVAVVLLLIATSTTNNSNTPSKCLVGAEDAGNADQYNDDANNNNNDYNDDANNNYNDDGAQNQQEDGAAADDDAAAVEEDYQEQGDDGAVEEYQEEEDDEQQQQMDGDYYDGDGELYNTFTVCSDAVIEVKDVKIYCDSPGTFYYGSGKYRNSPSCVPGDKGKILVDFYIAQPDVIQQAGGYVVVDISAQGNSGWYQDSHVVYENADLCSLSSLKRQSRSTCPFQGYYRVKTNFHWDESNSNSDGSSFYPVVTVGFKSSIKSYSYDYGGANTKNCRGSTFATWTQGISTQYANAIGNFMKTFGILLITIAVMGAFVWFMVQRPTSVKDAGRRMGIVKKDVFLDEDFNFDKIKSPKNDGDLFDF